MLLHICVAHKLEEERDVFMHIDNIISSNNYVSEKYLISLRQIIYYDNNDMYSDALKELCDEINCSKH
jgi:hypothetical protein